MCDVNSSSKERAWIPPHGLDCSRSNGDSHPASSERGATLQLLNSLVDKKVPFIPAAGINSKNITWYTCGALNSS